MKSIKPMIDYTTQQMSKRIMETCHFTSCNMFYMSVSLEKFNNCKLVSCDNTPVYASMYTTVNIVHSVHSPYNPVKTVHSEYTVHAVIRFSILQFVLRVFSLTALASALIGFNLNTGVNSSQ